MHPLVGQLEQAFMPRPQEIAGSAEWVRSGAKLTEWSYSVGGATSFDGHSLGVEALLPDRPAHAPDNVALLWTCVISGPCRRLWRMWHGATQRLNRRSADEFARLAREGCCAFGSRIALPNKAMQLTKLRAAPVLQAEVPPCAAACRLEGGTLSQLIRIVGPTS